MTRVEELYHTRYNEYGVIPHWILPGETCETVDASHAISDRIRDKVAELHGSLSSSPDLVIGSQSRQG